jgi:hypothetical protein
MEEKLDGAASEKDRCKIQSEQAQMNVEDGRTNFGTINCQRSITADKERAGVDAPRLSDGSGDPQSARNSPSVRPALPLPRLRPHGV